MKNVFLAHPIFYATFPFPFDFNPISGNFLAKSRHFPFQLSRANAKVKGKINCFLTSASWLADLRTFCKLKCLSNRKTFFLGMFLCDYLTGTQCPRTGIWVKGSYLSQWLPQGEREPPKESKSRWFEILHGGSHCT